jgi:hypothetical protein
MQSVFQSAFPRSRVPAFPRSRVPAFPRCCDAAMGWLYAGATFDLAASRVPRAERVGEGGTL